MPKRNETEVILALDLESRDRAETVIAATGDQLVWVKIGLQTYLRDGPNFIRDLEAEGKKIFLDLKLHDIPNTMAKAIESLCTLPISMLTIHASAGPEAVTRCVETMSQFLPNATLLAVTVLTSLDDHILPLLGIQNPMNDQVTNLAALASEAGAGGIVCSPLEIHPLRKILPPEVVLVTPGIRPAGATLDDQKRVMNPSQAVQAGANYLVIGRPILSANDPAATLSAILEELSSGDETPSP